MEKVMSIKGIDMKDSPCRAGRRLGGFSAEAVRISGEPRKPAGACRGFSADAVRNGDGPRKRVSKTFGTFMQL